MLHYIWSHELSALPPLADAMFRDRALAFRDRLGWPVSVDAKGWEQDEYDRCGPLYVIVAGNDGAHLGSMRFLPTLGPTMVNDHFRHLAGRTIRHSRIWECTRFCLAAGAPATTSARLLFGALEFGLLLGLTHAVGVFDARMIRVYRALGWPPEILGQAGRGRGAVSAGLWHFDPALRPGLARRAGLPAGTGARSPIAA